jgi:hypothetical protein
MTQRVILSAVSGSPNNCAMPFRGLGRAGLLTNIGWFTSSMAMILSFFKPGTTTHNQGGDGCVEEMKTYQARVERGGRFWVVHVTEIVRATQARHLRELEAMTEDLISVMTGEAPSSFQVQYDLQLPESVQMHLKAAQELRERAAQAQTLDAN